jgi:hypothetical protein
MTSQVVQLRPNLDHCVETVARAEYRRGVRSLLAGEDDELVVERTELLRLFLETADFSDLRRRSESHLLEGREVVFTVYMEAGVVKQRVDVC